MVVRGTVSAIQPEGDEGEWSVLLAEPPGLVVAVALPSRPAALMVGQVAAFRGRAVRGGEVVVIESAVRVD